MVLPGSADIQRTIIVNDETTETTGQLEPDGFAVDGNGRVITTAISGTGAPTTQYTPALLSLYIDKDTDKVYSFVGGTSAAPLWRQIDDNWARDDLILDNNRTHNMDGYLLTIQTDGSNRIHEIDASNYNISFGDLDSDANETTFELKDSTSEILVSGISGNVLTVNTSAQSVTINEEYSLPINDGNFNQVITTDGSGSCYFDYAAPLELFVYVETTFDTTSTTDVIIPGTSATIIAPGDYQAFFVTYIGQSSGADRISEFSLYVNSTKNIKSVMPIFTTDIDDFHLVVLTTTLPDLKVGDIVSVRCNTEANTLTVYARNLTFTRLITEVL